MNKVKKKLIKFSSDKDLKFNEVDEFDLNHLLSCGRKVSSDGSLGWRPQVDMYIEEELLVICIDIAYLEDDNIQVKIVNNQLLIKGVREEVSSCKKRHYFKMEIDYGPFERSITLPVKVKPSTLSINYSGGFYTIKLLIDER